MSKHDFPKLRLEFEKICIEQNIDAAHWVESTLNPHHHLRIHGHKCGYSFQNIILNSNTLARLYRLPLVWSYEYNRPFEIRIFKLYAGDAAMSLNLYGLDNIDTWLNFYDC